MSRKCYVGLFVAFICFFYSVPLSAIAGDRCSGEGIVVKNLTMLNLWYKKNSGNCTMWRNNHILRIGPEDTVEIFSDLACSKLYCEDNPTYKKYESLDANSNCAVRILPLCNLSDM
jgi:hypothetical protein